jgi:hypothetical protein
VRFACGTSSRENVITAVKEFPACNYVLTVASPLLCKHPAFRPQPERVRAIACTLLEPAAAAGSAQGGSGPEAAQVEGADPDVGDGGGEERCPGAAAAAAEEGDGAAQQQEEHADEQQQQQQQQQEQGQHHDQKERDDEHAQELDQDRHEEKEFALPLEDSSNSAAGKGDAEGEAARGEL